MKIYCYSKCGTCKKALKYLKDHNIKYEYEEITEVNFSKNDIAIFHKKSNKEIKKLFNTSGKLYRELNMKDKISEMSLEEIYELLASDGMLIKRPILVLDDQVLIGFKEKEYESIKL